MNQQDQNMNQQDQNILEHLENHIEDDPNDDYYDSDDDYEDPEEYGANTSGVLTEYKSDNELCYKEQLAIKIKYSFPDKQQRKKDEETTGFKNVFIIRYENFEKLDNHFICKKLSKIIYTHCIVGQEIMLYPALAVQCFLRDRKFSCNNFIGVDGKWYTSVIISEAPSYEFVKRYDSPKDQTKTEFDFVNVKEVASGYYYGQRLLKRSKLGDQFYGALSGHFPFNGILPHHVETPLEINLLMKRISAFYGKSFCISEDQLIRCLKKFHNELREIKAELNVTVEEPTKKLHKDEADQTEQLFQKWKKQTESMDSLAAQIHSAFANWKKEDYNRKDYDYDRKDYDYARVGYDDARGLTYQAIRLCMSCVGSVETKYEKSSIFVPNEQEREIVKNLLIRGNRLACLISGLEETQKDFEAQAIHIRKPPCGYYQLTSSQWESL